MCTSLAKKGKLPFAYTELVFLVPNLKCVNQWKYLSIILVKQDCKVKAEVKHHCSYESEFMDLRLANKEEKLFDCTRKEA
jgi:hypothetical protein